MTLQPGHVDVITKEPEFIILEDDVYYLLGGREEKTDVVSECPGAPLSIDVPVVKKEVAIMSTQMEKMSPDENWTT